MNLNVFELGNPAAFGNTQLKQLITVGDKDLDLYAIRPHFYKHLAPAGSAYMQVQDANGRKIKSSETIAFSAIASGTGAGSYFHGYVRFLIDLKLKNNTQYYLSMCSTGYTYSAIAFVGWCNDFDLRKVSPDFTVPSIIGVNAPLDFELWARRDFRNGVY